jgi:hypothetical protein
MVLEPDRGHFSTGNSHCHSTANFGTDTDSSTDSRKASDTASSTGSKDKDSHMDNYSTDRGICLGTYIGMDIHNQNPLLQLKLRPELKGLE